MAYGQKDALEAIAYGEGVLAEERATCVTTATLLPEVHEAHSWRCGERDTHNSEREEDKWRKARWGKRTDS